MGLFDTVHFPAPLYVPGCAQPVTEVQTKIFGNFMENYYIGSILQDCPVLIGVVEESIWCASQQKGEQGTTHPVYFAIWHRILAGVYLDPSEAESRLKAVDRLDLIAWLDDAQRSTRNWSQRHNSLLSDIQKWHNYQSRPETVEKGGFGAAFWRLPEEILNAPDPLGALIETHRKEFKD